MGQETYWKQEHQRISERVMELEGLLAEKRPLEEELHALRQILPTYAKLAKVASPDSPADTQVDGVAQGNGVVRSDVPSSSADVEGVGVGEALARVLSRPSMIEQIIRQEQRPLKIPEIQKIYNTKHNSVLSYNAIYKILHKYNRFVKLEGGRYSVVESRRPA